MAAQGVDGGRGPRGAFLRPALAVGAHQAGPIGSVGIAQVLHRGEKLGRRGGVADRAEGEDRLAGLGTGDPGRLGYPADAEIRVDELLPPPRDPHVVPRIGVPAGEPGDHPVGFLCGGDGVGGVAAPRRPRDGGEGRGHRRTAGFVK